jgi:hypothetical protein
VVWTVLWHVEISEAIQEKGKYITPPATAGVA